MGDSSSISVLDQGYQYWIKTLEEHKRMGGIAAEYTAADNQGLKKAETILFEKALSENLSAVTGNSPENQFAFLIGCLCMLIWKYDTGHIPAIAVPVVSQEGSSNLFSLFCHAFTAESTIRQVVMDIRQEYAAFRSYQEYPLCELFPEVDFENLTTIVARHREVHPKADNSTGLVYTFFSEEEFIGCTIEYHSGTFSCGRVQRILRHYKNLVSWVLEHRTETVSAISLMDEEERRSLLYRLNETGLEIPETHLAAMIESAAMEYGDTTACICGREQISYRELWERSGAVAWALEKRGISQGAAVGLLTGRNIEFMVGMLAVLRMGCCYVPMDEKQPADRLQYILDDSGAGIVLVCGRKFDLDKVEEVDIRSMTGLCRIPECNIYPDDAAYILYTSGSTGNPKGVRVTHRNVVNLVCSMSEDIVGWSEPPPMGIALLTSLCFDPSVMQTFFALTRGAVLHLVPEETVREGGRLLNYFCEHPIRLAAGTPAHLRLLISGSRTADVSAFQVSQYISGGEALTVSLLCELHTAFGCNTPKVINVYGPTETCVYSTIFPVTWPEDAKRVRFPIGRPIHNTHAYVLDEVGQPAAFGIAGELYIGGSGVAAGYVGLEQQNRDCFLDDPFLPGSRMYRTGDRVRILEDGNIEFIERIDEQVKIRGYRIELGEIESVLEREPGVIHAAVIVAGELEEKRLCAYVAASAETDTALLKKRLGDFLPSYMVPEYIKVMEMLPVNRNGKVDKKALPVPDFYIDVRERRKPETEVQEKLLKIWSDILGVREFGITDRFFELGGNSLDITAMLSRVYQEFGVELSWDLLFGNPDIETLARSIEDIGPGDYQIILPSGELAYYPLSTTQKRMYITHQTDDTGIAYNTPMILKLMERPDPQRLEEAFCRLIRRHSVLRTSFVRKDGELVQRIIPEVDFVLHVKELSEESPDREIKRFIRPFSLDKPPLLRAGLLLTASGESYLMIDAHHIITDGVSLKQMLKETSKLYQGKTLKSLSLQYKDFCVWQEQQLKTEALKEQETYWLKEYTNGVAELGFPADYRRKDIPSLSGDAVTCTVDRELLNRMNVLAADTDTTLFTVLLASYAVLLSRYTGKEEIVIGVPAAARMREELREMVGPFVNTMMVRIPVENEASFLETVILVKSQMRSALRYQDYPLDMLVETLHLHNRKPLLETDFTFQNFGLQGIRQFGGIKAEHCIPPHQTTHTDLSVLCYETDEGLDISLVYATGLYRRSSVENILRHFIVLADSAVENPSGANQDLNIFSGEELEDLIYGEQEEEESWFPV